MDNQEIFTKVVSHLRKQNCRSFKGKTCYYRGDDGTKCAIGCMMEDDEYSLAFEGQTAKALLIEDYCYFTFDDFQKLKKFRSRFVDIDKEFLGALQGIHDLNIPENWESCFAIVAKEFHLIVPEKV